MKAMKSIIIVLTIILVQLPLMAQYNTGFQSTSSMMGSGSNLSSGGYLSADDYYNANMSAPSRGRRTTMDDDPFGGQDIGDVDNPNEPGSTPIGDGLSILLLLAAGYLFYRRKKQINMKHSFTNRALAIAIALTMSIGLMAVPAYRGWQTRTQPDGTTITIRLMGDEFYHYWENESGQQVQKDENGYWQIVGSSPTGEQVMVRRSASPMMKRSATPKKVGSSNPLNKGLVILVNFSDKSFTYTNADITAMLTGENYTTDGATGSAREYFYDQSYGQYNPQFDVVGPVTLSNNRAYYGGNDSNDDDQRPGQMINEACSLANSQCGVDFTKYDNNNDGYVDFVYVIYAGGGEADGGPDESIWPHSWDLSSAGISASSRRYDGKYILKYACSSERQSGDNGTRTTIGTFCHEFSHVIGMPDYYDIDYGTNYKNNATPGKWTIMDQGNYNNSGKTPPSYSTFDKYFMGWLTPENLGTSARSVTLNAIDHTTDGDFDGQGYQLNAAGSLAAYNNTGVQYYVENRQQTKWDKYCPGHGLLIWKVQYNQTAWNNNGPNDTDVRYAVVSASGNTTGIGTGADPFPGTKKKTSWTAVSDREIKSITENTTQKTITFTYINDVACHNVVVNGTNCTITPSADCVENGVALTATIVPKDASYDISNVTVTRGSTNITSYCTISSNKQSVTVPASQVTGAATDAITITATAAQNRWSYYLYGEHITPTEQEGAVTKGAQLQLTITSDAGYIISEGSHLIVEMGGNTLTWGSGYTYADGVLTISSVTGNVEITVEPGLDPDNSYTFVPLQNTAQITAGAKIVLVGTVASGGSGVQNVDAYLAGPVSGSYLTAAQSGFSYTDEAIVVPKTADNILVMEIGGTSNNWTLTANSKLLRATSTNVYLGGTSGTSTWKIGVNSLQTTDNYTMYFNAGSPRFKTYTSAQAAIKIFITEPTGEKPTAEITFAKTTGLTCRDGEVFQNIASTTYGTVTYSSSNPTNAPVDASGTVRPTAPGTYTITATVTGSSYYNGATASYTLEVTKMPQYAITWLAKGENFDKTYVREGDGLVLPSGTPTACDNKKVFVGWSLSSSYEDQTTAPDYVSAGDPVSANTTIYAIYAVSENGTGSGSGSVSKPFAATSGDIDTNIEYEATQGTAGTAPVINNGDIRVYQNGGLLTIRAKQSGINITSATVYSTQATTVQTSVDGGSTYSSDHAIAANGSYQLTGISAGSVIFKCTGTNKSSRLNVSRMDVTYSGAGGNVYTQYSTGCGTVEQGKQTPTLTLTDATKQLTVGATYTNVITANTSDGALSYTSSNPTIAEIDENGQVTALQAGNATITVSTAGTDTYYAKSVTYTITVVRKIDLSVAFATSSHEMNVGDVYTQTVTKADDNLGLVVYSSSNTTVATVDASSGKVSAKAEGTATITATIAQSAEYEMAAASYEVTVALVDHARTVTWKANGIVFAVQHYDEGDALQMPDGTPTCDGKTFQGWTATAFYLDPFNAPSDLFTTAESKTVTSNITYYAIFK